MKKTIIFSLVCVFTLIISVAYAPNTNTVVAASACNTPAGVTCPSGTVRTSCKAGESVNKEGSGNCHCNEGLTRGSDGMCTDGSGGGAEGEADCSAIESTHEEINKELATAKEQLAQAKTDLSTNSAAYQQAAAANPANVKAPASLDYDICVEEDAVVTCGEAEGCSETSSQCDILKAQLIATNQTTCIISAQAQLFKDAVIGTGGVATTTTTTTNTATTTATTTTTTATTTPTTTTTNTSNPIFTIGLSPNTIKQGDVFTVSATISSSSVSTYSISASKDNVNLGNLVTSARPTSTARPTSISQSFNTSSSILTGTYLIQISNDSNFTQYATAYLTVNPKTSTTSGFSQTTTTTATTNSNTTSSVSGLGKIVFLSPSVNSVQRKNITSQIHWGYNNYVSGNIELYVQTVCANGSVGCYPITSLIASNVPVASVYYNWMIPSSIPSNSYAILIAKQGATVLGYSSNFIVQ